ncbi:MAG: biotin carboxylase N-terminal domain-containing protein [Acidimicrobiia bacterium]
MQRVLVANRGAVAARIIRCLDTLGLESVAVYSDADADAPYLEAATTAVRIGAGPPTESYLDHDAVIAALKSSGADGLHPGYGFLAESAPFARKVIDTGAVWIGPSPDWVELMGHKTRAREFAARHGIPVGAGSAVLRPDGPEAMHAAAERIGYPLLVKPAGGGGGIGMLAVSAPSELMDVVERASAIAARGFGDGEVYLERLLERPRHIEFQILADRHGHAVHLFERDCSVQRRHQKIIEEAPAPGISRDRLDPLADRLVDVFAGAGYDSIGTVESLFGSSGEVTFLEMNTRLQVEHGVTEEITGVDLVAGQIRLATGERLGSVLDRPIERCGHAIEARVYAEDPIRFFPSPGPLDVFRPPEGIRVETGYREGQTVTPFYDPLLAKVIAHAPDRSAAIGQLTQALEGFAVEGVRTNIPALVKILRSEAFTVGRIDTGLATDVVAPERTVR